jgi:NADPH:quinone reductase-like Zn-dependent oxidoreductase
VVVKVAGTEVGEGVSGWSVGEAVVAFLPMTEPGAAAEYVAAPAEALAAVHDQATAGLLAGKAVLTPPERRSSPLQRMERA